jgi:uncharacterized protein YjdB
MALLSSNFVFPAQSFAHGKNGAWDFYYSSSNSVAKAVKAEVGGSMDEFDRRGGSSFTVEHGHGVDNSNTNFTYGGNKVSGWFVSSYGPYLKYATIDKSAATNNQQSVSLAKAKYSTSDRVYIGNASGDLADSKTVADITSGNYPILLNNKPDTVPSNIKTAISDFGADSVVLMGGTHRFDGITGIGDKYNIIRVGGRTRTDTYNLLNTMNGNFFTKKRPSYTGNYLYLNPSGVSLPASIRTNLENQDFNAAAETLLSYSQGNAARVSNGNPAVTIGCDGKILMTYYVSTAGDDAGTLVFQYFGPEFRINSIEVSPNPVNIRRGDTEQLTVTANYSDDSQVPVTNSSTYKSANTSIATINYRGLVTGKAVGTTTVTATYGGKSKAVTVNISAPDVMSISVSPNPVSIRKGDSKQLTVTAFLSDGTSKAVTNEATYWTDNTSLATVSSAGLVTGKAIGATTVTATYQGKSYAVTVNVRAPDVTSISVSPNPVNIRRGDTRQLVVTALLSDGTSKAVTNEATYRSGNTTIATVSSAGLVTGKAVGTTTVTTTYKGKSYAVTVNVRVPDVTSISVSPNPVSIRRGDTRQLMVTSLLSDGTSKNVTSDASYSSSNTSIAVVSSTGLITGNAVGATTVTAVYQGKSYTVAVFVGAPDVMSISVSPNPVNIRRGDTSQLTTTASLSDGTNQNVTSTASYSSANTSIATVSSGGLVTGKAVGTTTVTATYSGKSKQVTVNVRAPDVTSISVSPNPVNIRRGDTRQLAVTALLSDGTSETVTGEASYSSGSTTVATVSTGGLVTGKAIGTTIVTATYSGKSKQVTVNVKYPDVMSINVSPSQVNIRRGDSGLLTVTAHLSDGTSEYVTSAASYSIGDESKVSADGLLQGFMKITGKAIGTTTVTATYAGKTATSTVNVRKPDVISIRVESEKGNILRRKGTSQLIVIAKMSDGTSKTVTNKAAYNSSNPSAATVSDTGLLTGVNKGVTTITAEYEGKTDTIAIEVRPRLNLYIRTLQ